MSLFDPSRESGRSAGAKFALWLKSLGLGAAVLLAVGVSVGVGQSPGQKPSDDVMQLRVQSALDNDPELKPRRLAVLVNVVDRVAVIGGPVPDAGIADRLEAVAKAVPGIASVRVSVWVPPPLDGGDPLARKVNELMKGGPPKPTALLPVLSLPLPPPEPIAAPPKPAPVPPPPVPPKSDPITARRGPAGLLEPVPPTGTEFRPAPLAPGAAPLPYETIPPPNVPALPPADAEPERKPPPRAADPRPVVDPEPSSPLDELRKDARFAGLKVELTDGVAVVSGRPTNGSERAWELAQAVRKLPGVERVVVRR